MLNDERKPFIYNTNYCVLQVERRMIGVVSHTFLYHFRNGAMHFFLSLLMECRKVDIVIVHTEKSGCQFFSTITAFYLLCCCCF